MLTKGSSCFLDIDLLNSADIKDLRTLKVEGKRKVYPEDDLFSCLNDVLQKAKELSELAQQLLNKSGYVIFQAIY